MKINRNALMTLVVLGTVYSCQHSTVSVTGMKSSEKDSLSEMETLGKQLFFDENLSNPAGQSCASCHAPDRAFTDPEGGAFSTGILLLSGNRNAPSIAYASYSPVFQLDKKEGAYIGGQFWDGRARNLRTQVEQPLMNHLEMNNTDKKMVVMAVRKSPYAAAFKRVFGKSVFTSEKYAFDCIMKAIEAYERSKEVNPFSSKYDAYLLGEVRLTNEEKRGLELFNDPKKGNCAACHPSTPDAKENRVLFTDYTYDNLGIPAFPKQLGKATVKDLGLGAIVQRSSENGKFKVPTLRNVAITGPYFHNGRFATLEEVVEFYNNRDTGKFGLPEVAENVNREELGNLQLSREEVSAIVAFLQTLTDGYKVSGKNTRRSH